MANLDNVFSQEVKTKERDYLVNILGQYGVSTINHMTHIDNLSSILDNGLISHNNPYCKRDISNQGVNARRERIEPIYNKKIHDYVPFYMNIRNPMLYVVQKNKEMILLFWVILQIFYLKKIFFLQIEMLQLTLLDLQIIVLTWVIKILLIWIGFLIFMEKL